MQAYTYDAEPASASPTQTTTERGPPTAIDDTAYSAVDRWSGGASARFGSAATLVAYTHDDTAWLAQVASAITPTERSGRATGLPSVASNRDGVAAETGSSLIGKTYGLGEVVENPGLTIRGFQGAKTPGHALNQIINRGVSPSMLRNTVANPTVVLRQGSGNYLYLSQEAAVAMRADGQVVTAYGRADFRQHVLGILADAG